MALFGKEEKPNSVAPQGTPAVRREDERVQRPGDVHTLIGKGSEFDGKLTFEGQVRIDGKFTGQIHTKDVLVIGGGHAGCEAAAVAARMGARTGLISFDLSRIGR